MQNRLEKSIRTLYSSLKENIDYVDLNFMGIGTRVRTFTDDNGIKKEYTERTAEVSGVACLRDRFKIWLMSDQGDFHRNPEKGGFLTRNVVKRPFIDDNCPIIAALLKSEAESKFPELKIMDVDVSCDHSTRQWKIKVSILDQKTGLVDNTMYLNGESIAVSSTV